MKKRTYNLQIVLSAAAALFIALSPLLHGLHLVSASHTRNCCNTCINIAEAHFHGSHDTCHGNGMRIVSASDEGGSKGHDPNTCPLCRQFTELLKNQVIPHTPAAITLQDSPNEEQFYLPGIFFSISLNNIIPRAPPPCLFFK